MAFKAAKGYVIIGGVAVLIGGILLTVGLLTSIIGLTIAGAFGLLCAIVVFVLAFQEGQSMIRAICSECQKYMGNTGYPVKYSFVCKQYKENYDNNNKFVDYTFFYECTIVCPHCGNSNIFEYKLRNKSTTKADIAMDRYIKSILKLKSKSE